MSAVRRDPRPNRLIANSAYGSGPVLGWLGNRDRFSYVDNLRFIEGDAKASGILDRSIDVVVFHTTLCYVPNPDEALKEAYRVFRPGGLIAVFDDDAIRLH